LCGDALKVLDLMSNKVLPPHNIVKRWAKEALLGSIKYCCGRIVVRNPKLEATIQCNYNFHKFYNITTLAANSEECCILNQNALDSAKQMGKNEWV
jgi:hypothetical protein